MFERFVELVFKYRPVIFEQGELAFSPPWPAAVAVIAVLAAMGAARVGVPARPARTPRLVSRRAARAPPHRARACSSSPAPPGPRRPRRRAAAQRARRPRGRLAQHDDRRPRRDAAHRVRPRGVRPVGRAARPRSARRFTLRRLPLLGSTADACADPDGDDLLRARARTSGRSLQRTAEELAGPPGVGHRARDRRRRHVARADGRRASRR